MALSKPEQPPIGRRPSAVLMALFPEDGQIKVILTERSHELRHHAGQISFPGGRIESGEQPKQAALREAQEEINLNPDDVEVIGYLPGVITTANFHIAPVVGVLKQRPLLTASPDEVSRILIEDLSALLDRSLFEREPKQYKGVDYQTWVIKHPEEYIWGATAKLLVQCAELYYRQLNKGAA